MRLNELIEELVALRDDEDLGNARVVFNTSFEDDEDLIFDVILVDTDEDNSGKPIVTLSM